LDETQVKNQPSKIDTLIRLIETLRGETGCPWDQRQTPETMANYLVEEMYELIEAIESDNPDDVCEELGDVWFHVLFIAQIYKELGHFEVGEVAQRITDKMTRRHPHVFGNTTVETTDEVKTRWQEIKAKEKKNRKHSSILDSVPKKAPPLMRAYRISARAAGAGFDWNDVWGVITKVEEELSELKTALRGESQEKIALELGDILFTLVNVARFAKIHPDSALTGSIKKFENRFRHMEQAIAEEKKRLEAVPQEEKENYWEAAKKMFES